MKLNIAFASLVASVALCSQSYGFDLLDRMLGGSGCGCDVQCCETAVTCCEADPNCGADVVDPSCGCQDACDPCATESCCNKALITINLPKIKLIQIKRCKPACATTCCETEPGCAVVDPSCGADPSCGCGPAPCSRKGLLDRIFSRRHCGKVSCCEATCGADACGCGSAAPAAAEGHSGDAPAPPAPVVDPAAFSAPARTLAVR